MAGLPSVFPLRLQLTFLQPVLFVEQCTKNVAALESPVQHQWMLQFLMLYGEAVLPAKSPCLVVVVDDDVVLVLDEVPSNTFVCGKKTQA